MKGEVIIACDFSSAQETLEFLSAFGEVKPYLKVGMELFYREGASFVRELVARGYRIFLDLKLHDIPNTVKKAMRNVAALGVHITNVHAAGGIRMMRAAAEGLAEGSVGAEKPLLIAVTQLTSTDDSMLHDELWIHGEMPDVVEHYALNARAAGLDGVVCSPLEAPLIQRMGMLSVTPGIRLAGDSHDDQKRITTPREAAANGSTFIVVGRSITAAADPVAAYLECMRQFSAD